MKRICLLILSSLLMLTSCQIVEKTAMSQNDDESKTFYIEGELAEIGDFSGNLQNKRYYNEYTTEFLPSEDYKTVLPFVSKTVRYQTSQIGENDFKASRLYNSYGFCTVDGKIVMDARDDIENVFYNETPDGFGYYIASISKNDNENLMPDDVFISTTSLLIPKSGKWCLKLENGSYVLTAGYGVIGVCVAKEYDVNGYSPEHDLLLYDYDGKLLKNLGIKQSAQIVGENLMLINDYSEESVGSYFCDFDGEMVYGPFSYASGFNEYGVGCIEDLNGEYYLMNTSGERMTTEQYESIFSIYGNDEYVGFYAKHKENSLIYDVFDSHGIYLDTAKSTSRHSNFILTSDKKVINAYYTDDGYEARKVDGEKIVNEEFGVSPNDYCSLQDLFLYRDKNTSQAVLMDYYGNTFAEFDELEYVSSMSFDKKYVVYTSGRTTFDYIEDLQQNIVSSTAKLHIYDVENQKILQSFDGEGFGSFFGENDRYIKIVQYDTENYLYGGDGGYSLYDTKTQKMLFVDCTYISEADVNGETFINVCTKNKSTLYNGNMKPVLTIYYE